MPTLVLNIRILSYLWGIETLWYNIHRQIQDRFYLTYEELKHWFISSSLSTCSWFYLTYEELKHHDASEDLVLKTGFYLTYEELKQVIPGDTPSDAYTDFILPMRNWNYRLYYQWKKDCKRFYLTYEELKPSPTTGTIVFAIDFILPMRNWNPQNNNKIGFDLGILSYLWGIETTSQYKYSSCCISILSYLWGIETAMKKLSTCKTIKILSYLWGIETLLLGTAYLG